MPAAPPPTDDDRAAMTAALRWMVDIGVDEPVEVVPRNRFAAPESAPASASTADSRPAPRAPAATDAATALRPPSAMVADVEALVAACTTVAELSEAVAAFEGCALKRTAKNTVFADGNPAADLMLVGEAPGAEEDRQGRPFVGAAGKLLDLMLAAIDRDRTSAYITNILFWRPPGNRNPTDEEVAQCLTFVRRHVQLVNPRVLVMLGGISAKTLLGRREGITRLRGQWHRLDTGDQYPPFDSMPTFHPAFLLRQPARKREVWRDLLAIRAKLQNE